MEDLVTLEKTLKVNFKDAALLKTAVTHRSYLNEHKEIKFSNERLEFLGDAVLQFLTSRFLYEKFPQSPEGDLTNFRASLVCTPSLAAISKNLNLGKYLLLSRGEEDSGGREREYILANTFEAVLGAIFFDQGVEKCRELLTQHLFPEIDQILKNETYKDYKSRFQEFAQERYNLTPEYREINSWGPDHDKKFLMGVFIGEKILGKGEGSSKQKAEQDAARDALVSLKKL